MAEKMYSQDEMTTILRNAIEDRAEWFWRLYTAFRKTDPEGARGIVEKVIHEFGQRKGKKMNLPDDANAQQFLEGIMDGPAFYAFAMKPDKLEPQEAGIKFYACPFMDVYDKLGLSMEEKVELCEVANCGDVGMVSLFPHLQLDFPKMLSKGDSHCHMHVISTKE